MSEPIVNDSLTPTSRTEDHPMADPDAPAEAALEADLGLATDQEWLDAHAALTDLLEGTDFPMEELTFIWDPELDASTLIDFHTEPDHGPSYTYPEVSDGPA